jgi:hypothetical protein
MPDSIVWLFLAADEPTCKPPLDWREAPWFGPVPVPIQEVMLSTQKFS